MAVRTPVSHWCFLRSNEKLKLAVKHRIKQHPLSLTKIGDAAGVPSYRVSSWLKGNNRHWPSQFQVIKLCNYLGINTDLLVEFFDESA